MEIGVGATLVFPMGLNANSVLPFNTAISTCSTVLWPVECPLQLLQLFVSNHAIEGRLLFVEAVSMRSRRCRVGLGYRF